MASIHDTLHHLRTLCERILDGGTVADEDLIHSVESMELATNCESAAEALFAAVSVPCILRPGLRPALLALALDPLFCLGLTEADEVMLWARETAARGHTYVPWGEHTRRFAFEILEDERATVQAVLDRMTLASRAQDECPSSS